MMLGLTLIYALLMGGLMTDLSMRQQALLRTQQTKNALNLADSVALRAIGPLTDGDRTSLDKVVSDIASYPDLDDMMIADVNGRVLAHTKGHMVGTRLADAGSRQILQGAPLHQLVERSMHRFEVMSPVMQANRLLGWVHLSLDAQESEARINEVAQQGMGFAVLAVVLGTVAVYLVPRLFIERVAAMRSTTPLQPPDPHAPLTAASHRLEDTLQVVQSLLSLQQRCSQDPHVRAALANSTRRIHAIVVLHDMLSLSDDQSSISLPDYVHHLVGDLKPVADEPGGERVNIELDIPAMGIQFDSALPFGILLTELLSNCLQHAFAGRSAGTVRVCLTRLADDIVRLRVSDDGVGIARNGDALPTPPGSVGLKLASALASQMGGSLQHIAACGTVFEARLCLF